MIRGVIFDMDGTLLDTEKLFVRFWVEAAQQMGYPMERRHALMIRGMARDAAKALLEREVCADFPYAAVRARRCELMDACVAAQGVQTKPGARETLALLRRQGYGIALATASHMERAQRYLRAAGLYECFDFIATADRVAHGKPAPDIYLYAAQGLGIAPGQAVGVEDAPSGIRSIHSAGMRAVLIPDQDEPDEQILKMCSAVLEDLSRLPAWIAGENEAANKAENTAGNKADVVK